MIYSKARYIIACAVIACLLLINEQQSEACNVAVVTAGASATGRPFLWKNRDHAESYRHEVIYYPEVIPGVGGSIRLIGETFYDTDINVCTGGVNESGFAIANTTCVESQVMEANNVNTELMEVALEECRTLSDFEDLVSEFTSRWTDMNISGIFGVIDASGGAAVYEMWSNGNGNPIMYRKFDANTGHVYDEYGQRVYDYTVTPTVGFVNRTNSNHTDGWITIWSDTPRELRARQVMTGLYADGELSPRNMMRQVAKDVCGGDPVDYCSTEEKVMNDWNDDNDSYLNPNRDGQMETRYCISRYKTSMGLVIEGAASSEDASLSTMWVSLCEPSLSVFLPYFPFGGEVSLYANNNEHSNDGYYWDGVSSASDTNAASFMNMLFDCVQANPFTSSSWNALWYGKILNSTLYKVYKDISVYANNGCPPVRYADGAYMDQTIDYPALLKVQEWSLPLEDAVFDRTEEFISVLEHNPDLVTPELMAEFSDYCNKYVYENYSNQSDNYFIWGYEMPEGDTVAPTVESTSIADGARGVDIDTDISVTFSEAMNESSINTSTFVVTTGSTTVSGSVSYDSRTLTATFNPSSSLSYSTAYTVTLDSAVEDLAENSLESDYSWSFTSESAPDTTPPEVSGTSIPNGAADVAVSSIISATFSEELDSNSVSTSTVLLYDGYTQVSGTVSYNASTNTAVFTPYDSLSYDTAYTAQVTTGVCDVAGNYMSGTYSWSFITSDTPDTAPPTVVSTSIGNGAADINVDVAISASFNEILNSGTVTESTFMLYSGSTQVNGTVTYDSGASTATFTPSALLENGTYYTAELTTGIEDLAGNNLERRYSWSFTTAGSGTGDDTTPPAVVSTSIADGETDVATDESLSITFSEAMNADTINSSTFYMYSGFIGIFRVSASVSYDAATNTAVLNPGRPLSSGRSYNVVITTGVEDVAGNNMESAYTMSFRTVSSWFWWFNEGSEDEEVSKAMLMQSSSDGGSYSEGCGTAAEASTFAGGTRPVLPGLISLLVTMFFPFSLVSITRTIRRRKRGF